MALAENTNADKGQRGFGGHVLYVLSENPITAVAFGLFALNAYRKRD